MGITSYPNYNNPSCTSIVNYWSAGGAARKDLASVAYPDSFGMYGSATGSLTADTWDEVLNISGSGILEFLGMYVLDGTSRSIGVKVVVDGTTVFEADSSVAADGTGYGINIVGLYCNNATTKSFGLGSVVFNSTLSISVRSSLTETDKSSYYYKYQLT